MPFAKRVSRLMPSLTLAIDAKAKALKKAGQPVISFGAGEPDFDTPQHIQEAAIKAMHDGMTRYTPAAGLLELRQAVADKYTGQYKLPVTAKNVVISCGAKHALYNLFQVLVDDGDEVLIPAPYWVSYPDMVRLAGGVPVIVPTTEKSGFCVTAELLDEFVTPRTKLLVLNSPSNPTGAAYDRRALSGLAHFVLKHNLLAISDEIYEHLLYDGFEFTCFAAISEELKNNVVVVSGVSKTYAMTGWRIGWTVGPEKVMDMLANLQSQSTSNPTSFAQSGAMAALQGPQDCVKQLCEAFAQRRRYMLDRLARIPRISCFPPQGAFYAFPRVDAYYGKKDGDKTIAGSLTLSEHLLEKVLVAVVPGIGFGLDANIRLSYATSMAQIEEGLNRIEKALIAL